MSRKTRNTINTFLRHTVLVTVGFLMVYPLVWVVGASFKTNSEMFSNPGFIPRAPTLSGYKKGMAGYENMNFLHFMVNTYKFVIPRVLVTVISAVIAAYGFVKFESPGKRASFVILLSTLFLPQVVLNVPQYVLFNQLGWLDTYLPLVIPPLLTGDTYFVYMLVQFLRDIPRELEEAIEIDRRNVIQWLWYVVVSTPKLFIVSCALFQFVWSPNDFMGPLICVNMVSKYPMSVFLRMSTDMDTGFGRDRVLAMSLLTIVLTLIVFSLAQSSFVDGIAAGGIKGQIYKDRKKKDRFEKMICEDGKTGDIRIAHVGRGSKGWV